VGRDGGRRKPKRTGAGVGGESADAGDSLSSGGGSLAVLMAQFEAERDRWVFLFGQLAPPVSA